MSDLIDRQQAIYELTKLARDNFTLQNSFSFYLRALHDAADRIKALPSAEPEQKKGQVMSDLIDRQQAIDALEKTDWYHIGAKGNLVHGANPDDHIALYKAEDIHKLLETLPSAER